MSALGYSIKSPSPPPLMKAIIIILAVASAAFTLALTGCQGLSLTASTPYGDLTSVNGATTITPKPIIVPVKPAVTAEK